MEYFINKLSIIGAKNIDKRIELLFTNQTITNKTDFNKSNIKAIYGPNGSGKSALISAMYIYKRLLLDNKSIFDPFVNRFILETINKKLNYLNIEIIFTVKHEDRIKCYKHTLTLGTNNNDISIINEEIYILKGNLISDDKFSPIICINNGIINFLGLNNSNKECVINSTLNLLSKQSICSLIDKINFGKLDVSKNFSFFYALYNINELLYNLIVELNKDDVHLDYIVNKHNNVNTDALTKSLQNFPNKSYEDMKNFITINEEDIVEVNKFNKYMDSINKLVNFIKIFKPSLININIDKKLNGSNYICKKVFEYKEYSVCFEYESTGIKKLVKLFNSLRASINGQIVFIDEIDSNLHDIYLSKLLEFFKYNSCGQLCFTTHNLNSIEILKDKSHSLEFLSLDSRCYSWVKDGNKSPVNRYINGLIPYSPFNIENFEFDVLLDD